MSPLAYANMTAAHADEFGLSLATAAAALGTLFTERASPDSENPAAVWLETHGALAVYDGLTQLAITTERVWQSAPLTTQEHVVWDFEFLDAALGYWLTCRGPIMPQDNRWPLIQTALEDYLRERQSDA